MNVIFSRKGFDSTYGGFPSIILPEEMDSKMISFPIPETNPDSTGKKPEDIKFLINEKYQNNVVKEELESKKIEEQEKIEFYFYNKYYFVVKMNKKRQLVRYFKIYRINSDEKNFYLYTDKTHAFIVSKDGFIKGTAKEFDEFMAKKCKFKYSKQID